MKDLCEKIVLDTGHSGDERNTQFFITDDYGRSIYILYGPYAENIEDRFATALLFNTDGTYNEKTGIMELKDKYNYQDQLKVFKELNNWNKPI